MSNFGRVALRSRNDLVLTTSALLTSMVGGPGLRRRPAAGSVAVVFRCCLAAPPSTLRL